MKKILPTGKLAHLLILLSTLVMFYGCYDMREVDSLAYPLAVGLDMGETDILRLTLQLASPLAIGAGGGGQSGGGGGGGQGESSSFITIETPSLYSGLNLINNILSKQIEMSHAKAIVFSRKLAETGGVGKYLHAIIRGREFRPDIFVLVSNGPAEDYLKNVKPILESNPSKYYELLLGKSFAAFYPNMRLSDFYNNDSDFSQPVAILADLSKYNETEEIRNSKSTDVFGLEERYSAGRFTAGDIPIVAKQKNEVMGMAVFKSDRMVGTTNGVEAVCHHLLRGDYKYSYWTIPDPYDVNKIIVLNIQQRKRPDIKVKLHGDSASINVRLDLEGDLIATQSHFEYESDLGIVERVTKELIRKQTAAFIKKTQDEFDSDICGFGRYVKGQFLTWDSWKKFDWFGKYKNTPVNVSVDFKIRRTGLIIKAVGGI